MYGDARKTCDSLWPIRPGKLRFVALMHFIWMRAGKNNFAEPLVYGSILAVLLGWRAWRRLRR